MPADSAKVLYDNTVLSRHATVLSCDVTVLPCDGTVLSCYVTALSDDVINLSCDVTVLLCYVMLQCYLVMLQCRYVSWCYSVVSLHWGQWFQFTELVRGFISTQRGQIYVFYNRDMTAIIIFKYVLRILVFCIYALRWQYLIIYVPIGRHTDGRTDKQTADRRIDRYTDRPTQTDGQTSHWSTYLKLSKTISVFPSVVLDVTKTHL